MCCLFPEGVLGRNWDRVVSFPEIFQLLSFVFTRFSQALLAKATLLLQLNAGMLNHYI